MERSTSQQDDSPIQPNQDSQNIPGNMQTNENKSDENMEVDVKPNSQECCTSEEKGEYKKQQKEVESIKTLCDKGKMLHGECPAEQNSPESITYNKQLPMEARCLHQSDHDQNTKKNKEEEKNIIQPEKKETNQKIKTSGPREQKQKQQHQQKSKKDNSCSVSENQERVNYLVQVSKFLATMSPTHRKDSATRYACADQALASQIGALATGIGRRCVMRLSPDLKRSLCKGCGVTLVYGVNARVRHRSFRQKHLVVTCLACRTIKKFVNDPKHKLWCENEEAVL